MQKLSVMRNLFSTYGTISFNSVRLQSARGMPCVSLAGYLRRAGNVLHDTSTSSYCHRAGRVARRAKAVRRGRDVDRPEAPQLRASLARRPHEPIVYRDNATGAHLLRGDAPPLGFTY
jgi:hypothetical protein